MKKFLHFSLLCMLSLCCVVSYAAYTSIASVNEETEETVNVVAEFANGTVTLTFEDYANGQVQVGEGEIYLENEVGVKVATLTNPAFGDLFNQLKYSLSVNPGAGFYKVVIPAGAAKGNKTDAFGACSDIPACSCNIEIKEESGETVDGYFGKPTFEVVSYGESFAVKFVFPDSKEDYFTSFKEARTGAATLYEDGVSVATSTFGWDEVNFIFAAMFNYTPVEGKEYKVVFAEGCYEVFEMDGAGNVTNILEKSPESEYVWVAGAGSGNDNPAAGEGWTMSSVTPGEGNVESLKDFAFALPATVGGVMESVTLSLVCDNGKSYQVSMYDNFMGGVNGSILVDEPIKEEGIYTLTIPAGTFSSFINPALVNAEMSYSWVIGDAVLPNKHQEEIFVKNTALTAPIVIETEGVKMTTEGREFMGTTIDVTYNMYEEGELDWKNGTKLIFTAKDKITGIVIGGQFIDFAEADKGEYSNGAWKGTIEAGETVTLTANDGINVTSITVLYNGAQYVAPVEEQKEVNINLDITKTDWSTIGNQNGEVIGTVSCDAEVFDHYVFSIKCTEDPDAFISFQNLTKASGNITCYAWEGGTYDLYKDYHYILTVEAYDEPYFNAVPVATKTYEIVGTGKIPTVYNNTLRVSNVSLESDDVVFNGFKANGSTFDVTFSEPVSKVVTWIALGFDGSKNMTASKKSDDGTVWTFILPSDVDTEGAQNVMFQVWDNNDIMARGENGDNAFALNIIMSNSSPEDVAVSEIAADKASNSVYTVSGTKVNAMQKGNIYVVNGKKVVK